MIPYKKRWKAIKSYKKNLNKPYKFTEIITRKKLDGGEIQFIRTIIGKSSGKVIFTMHPYKGSLESTATIQESDFQTKEQ